MIRVVLFVLSVYSRLGARFSGYPCSLYVHRHLKPVLEVAVTSIVSLICGQVRVNFY
jgi:hypothetical protein